MAKTPKTPDKSLRFPNPKFIAFMKRFWNSEPVTQTEKDTWNSGGGGTADPYAPLIIVDKINIPIILANTQYQIVNTILPDIGDDLDIELISSSSSGSMQILNSGSFNITGSIVDNVNAVHFELNLAFYPDSYIKCSLKHYNYSDTSLHILNENIEPTRNGKVYLFENVTMNGANQVLNFALDVNADTDTIKLIIEFESITDINTRTLSNRIEIRSY